MLELTEQQAIRNRTTDLVASWQIDERGPLDAMTADDYLDLVVAASLVAEEATLGLQRWVSAARRAGASWERIGDALGISRQAAQKRFAGPVDEPPTAAEKRVKGMTAFNEEAEMAEQGAAGYELFRVGFLTIDFRFVGEPVENVRKTSTIPARTIAEMEADGWTHQANWYPFTYYSRRA